VKLYHQGGLSASGRISDRTMKDSQLYRVAVAARRQADRLANPKTRRGPELIRAASRPAARADDKTPRRRRKPVKPRTGRKPVKPVYQPVTLRSDALSSRQTGEGVARRRVTVAKGNVYLCQGHPDSDQFLELRSQAAVVFSIPGAASGAIKLPAEQGMAPAGSLLGKETIVGVYLEGDVVIARGERYFRGPQAYYDFVTHRSIMINAVFRTIQEQRNVPVYIRAQEARTLSQREMWFRNAKVSTSDFYSPTYHIGARRTYVKETTIYEDVVDPETGKTTRGVKLSEQSFEARMRDITFNVRSIPVLYWPWTQGDLSDGNSPLRKVQIGSDELGVGVNTEWHLFRLLGLIKPKGFKGRAELGIYEDGAVGGLNLQYKRDKFSGYAAAYGIVGQEEGDDFGDEREDVEAPSERSRVTWRHKQFPGDDWMLQFEFSYQSDPTFLEKFFPGEFHAGKDQETLVYAKKQRDNWVFDALVQVRVNDFYTRTESWPDLGFYVIGQPVGNTPVVWFSEQHGGLKRWLPNKDIVMGVIDDSDALVRLDTRQELDLPLHAGPVNIVPYVVGRFTYWSQQWPVDGVRDRPYGQVGVKATTHLWRIYKGLTSRLWDLDGIRHILTPEATAFLADAGDTDPEQLYPMDYGIERRITDLSGFSVGVTQRWQTKRGPARKRRIVDWMRLKVDAGFFSNRPADLPADGRLFRYRPEYSLGRNYINFDYEWNISEGTTFLADANYDIESRRLGRSAVGLTVKRSPRFKYYLGFRTIEALDSSVGTVGFTYKLSKKYTLSVFEQYDFDFRGGKNVATSVRLVRKFPRWYAGFTFVFDQTEDEDEIGLYLTFWPEGIPEFRVSSGRLTPVTRSSSDEN